MNDPLENKIDLNPQVTVSQEEADPRPPQKPVNFKTSFSSSPRIPVNLLRKLAKVFLVFIIFLVILGIFVVRPALKVFVSSQETFRQAQSIQQALKEQNLIKAKEEVVKTKDKLTKTQSIFQKNKLLGSIPLLGQYWQDGLHLCNGGVLGLESAELALNTMIPHADIIGFKGTDQQEILSAEDKMIRVLRSLKEVSPDLGKIEEKLSSAQKEIFQINENRYPESFRGIQVRDKIIQVKKTIEQADKILSEAKPLIEILPQLLGDSQERKYLVLFQNDGELRPTGGFITAYAILRAEKGKIRAVKSNDIYELDSRFMKKVAAPEPIKKYLSKAPYWYLRDMNLDPDFAVSMQTFRQYFETIPEEKVVGIIAVDTQVLKGLLDVLGPVNVPGFGKFTTENDPRCNCPNIIYELELLADRPLGTQNPQRKAFLGPMMQEILFNALGAPKDRWPQLFEKIFQLVAEKHMLFYFYDESEQKAIEAFGGAGQIKDYAGDYLHINDSNFGGAKSNLYISQEVEQIIKVESGKIIKTINITYKNPQEASNCDLEAGQLCLNGPCPTWLRLYLPQGSKLLDSSGSEKEVTTKDELGKTVLESFLTIRPKGVAKISFKVELPDSVKSGNSLKMLLQKQPGKDSFKYLISTGSQQKEIELNKDQEVEIAL